MPKYSIIMDQSVRLIPLSERIPKLVGRRQELERIDRHLNRKNARTLLYYYSPGGLGKTRLLEEIVERAQRRPTELRCSGIIDLYHTDIHSRSDIQAAIADGLDPNNTHFQAYRSRQVEHDGMYAREDKSEPAKQLRSAIAGTFRNNLIALTRTTHVVLCFDTFERIQFPTLRVDQTAATYAPDLWLSSWLMAFLSELRNVVVVFAGRPRRTPEEQGAFIEHLENRWQGQFEAVELLPLPREETEAFISALPDGETVLPAGLREVAHNVTEGKPVFLHLLVDLLRGLHPQPRELRGLLEQWKAAGKAFNIPEGYRSPQEYIQAQIISSLYNETEGLGSYLGRMALLPKGVDQDILVSVLGMEAGPAAELLDKVRDLSFIKEYKKKPFGAQSLGDNRLFLHDELYVLMTSPRFIPTVRRSEREIAKDMVRHLNAQVKAQQAQLGQLSRLEQTQRRRQIEQLQVESLYYALVADPRAGYGEYRNLANQATQTDNGDFGMKLLDEFLRFYNDPRRALQLERAGIKPERLIRDRTLMWMERLHWSDHYPAAIKFAEEVMQNRRDYSIGEDAEGVAVFGNIAALWARDCQVTQGYRDETLERAQEIWQRLTDNTSLASVSTNTALLARARLATSVGYLYREASHLEAAKEFYEKAVESFERLEGFEDEMALLLSNMAFLNANQGLMEQANLQANRARRYYVGLGNQHGEAYALSTLANVEIRAGDHDRAVDYATEALKRFEPKADARGMVLALLARTQALRKAAKADILKGEKVDDLGQRLDDAGKDINRAIELARSSWLSHELPMLYAKRAKVYREMGLLARNKDETTKAEEYFRKGQLDFERALGIGRAQAGQLAPIQSIFDRYDVEIDFAEHFFRSGKTDEAERMLAHLEEALPSTSSPEGQKPEYNRLRGKVQRLRTEMAQKDGQKLDALKHAIRAYSYFTRFSEHDRSRKGMSNKTQELLLGLAEEDRKDLYQVLNAWIEVEKPEPLTEIQVYVRSLK